MFLFLFIIIIIIIIILFNNNTCEKMADIVPYDENKLHIEKSNKCCLVEKQYIQNNSINGGDFKYIYTVKHDEECNPNKYDMYNKEILMDNNNCNSENSNLGSCRMINNECVDFVTKNYCDTIPGMVWSNKTCNNPLEFVWKDNIIRNVPEKNNDGVFTMFPEKQE